MKEETEEEAAVSITINQQSFFLSPSPQTQTTPTLSPPPTPPMADLSLSSTPPHHHRRHHLSLRPQPGLLCLLLPCRSRLLLERRPKVQPSSAQFYVVLYSLPWLLKPVWGLLTDVFPIAGFRRRPYFVLSGIIGAASASAVGLIGGLPAAAALGCLIGVNLVMAVASVAIDACIAKSSMEVRELAGDLQSLCGFCSSAGALIGYSSSGFVVCHLGPQGALGLLVIPPAAILVLGFVIYELKVTTIPNLSSERKVTVRVGGAVANMWRTMSLPQIWKPALFIFLSLAPSVTTHEGHFYWYTDPKAGPGFSKEFVGLLYSVGAVASMLGVIIYHKFLRGFPFRNLLFCMQLLFGLSGMMDLFWVLRLNLVFKIPDSFFAVCEESILRSIQQIRWIPMMV